MSETGSVTVATSGQTVERDDRCVQCDSPMLYNVRDETVRYSFCPNYYCGLWLSPVGGHATPEYAEAAEIASLRGLVPPGGEEEK